MKICKNRNSGNYFVFIEYVVGDNVLVVTPQNETKVLERRFFENPIEGDERALLSAGLITELQLKAYQSYVENRKQDTTERMEIMIEEMTPYELEALKQYLMKEVVNRKPGYSSAGDEY